MSVCNLCNSFYKLTGSCPVTFDYYENGMLSTPLETLYVCLSAYPYIIAIIFLLYVLH